MQDNRLFNSSTPTVWTPSPAGPPDGQSPTGALRELDAATLRRGLWELAGVAILALLGMAWLGFTWEAAKKISSILAVLLALTFILKEPSLEVMLKSLWSVARRIGPRLWNIGKKAVEMGLQVTVLSERRDFDAQAEAAFILICDRGVSPARDNVIDCFAGNRPAWQEWRDRCVFKGILIPGARGGGLKLNPSLKSSASAWAAWIAPSNKKRLDPYTGKLENV